MSPQKGKHNENCGRKYDQKMKPFLVYQYLLKNTDENNFKTADDIIEHLENQFEISAERRGIYRDIAEINKAILAVSEGIPLQEAEERIFEDEEEKVIKYDKSKKGFYVSRRDFEFYDIRILAECVYSAKFLDESRAKHILDAICSLANEEQAQIIKHDVNLIGRSRTLNKDVLQNIDIISKATSKKINGEKHVPEKISFNYLSYTIDDVTSLKPRRKNQKYIVSPYHLVIDNGYYYLLCSAHGKKMTYRVDRMKNVELTGVPRTGAELFDNLDIKEYLRQTFSMYDGGLESVTIRFEPKLLDTMIDRFGNNYNAHYEKCDDKHYSVSTRIKISNQFYGWLLGFGNKAVLTSPPNIVSEFKNYVEQIRAEYE